MVLIEGMASGLPYVCSDIHVFKEVTENGKGGLLFKAKNPDDMADKIQKIMKNEELYSEKQKECFGLAKKYDWKKIVLQIKKVYKGLIEK